MVCRLPRARDKIMARQTLLKADLHFLSVSSRRFMLFRVRNALLMPSTLQKQVLRHFTLSQTTHGSHLKEAAGHLVQDDFPSDAVEMGWKRWPPSSVVWHQVASIADMTLFLRRG